MLSDELSAFTASILSLLAGVMLRYSDLLGWDEERN